MRSCMYANADCTHAGESLGCEDAKAQARRTCAQTCAYANASTLGGVRHCRHTCTHARTGMLTRHAATGIRENALRESIEVYLKDISEAMAKREPHERDALEGSCQPSASRLAAAADKTTGGEGGEGQDVCMDEDDAAGMGADKENGLGVGSYSSSGKFLVDMRMSHDHISTHAAKLLAEKSAEAGQAWMYRRFSQEVFSTASDQRLDATREVHPPLPGAVSGPRGSVLQRWLPMHAHRGKRMHTCARVAGCRCTRRSLLVAHLNLRAVPSVLCYSQERPVGGEYAAGVSAVAKAERRPAHHCSSPAARCW